MSGDDPRNIHKSCVNQSFWHSLASLKLDHLGVDESPVPITGFYAPASSPVSISLTVVAESLPPEPTAHPILTNGDRNKCCIPGTLYNTNTIESFKDDEHRQSLFKAEAQKIWEDIHSGRVEQDSSLLSRFLLITFADLKNYEFYHSFAFPALVLDPPATIANLKPASQYFSLKEAESLIAACKEWRNSSTTTGVPFFLVSIDSNSNASIKHLNDWEFCRSDGHKYLFGFYDPCHLLNTPGWPLHNFIAFICSRWDHQKIRFFCYREHRRGFADLGASLVGEALISVSLEWKDQKHIPNAVGWEFYEKGEMFSKTNLANSMNSTLSAVTAAELNLKLMKWRALPSLDLNTLSATKCLLLGAGTLGCQVARMLMAWGVHKITLVDRGKVSNLDPLWQSLYTSDDCGKYKALAAKERLAEIYPAVKADGVVMSIPMPGNPVPIQDEHDGVLECCELLQDLIDSHDAVFLLTGTRESRWLPTLLCSHANKITVTAALGFDKFLVMRHGAGPLSDYSTESVSALSAEMGNSSLADRDTRPRLGCYFCSDVVAPIESTSNRTLDQQCTVTRPGLAPIASSLVVELLVNVLHHPHRIYADATDSGLIEQPLGILPHQIEGSLSQVSQRTLDSNSSSCTACCCTVVTEFHYRRMDFVLQAINHPTYLEGITGLTELEKAANRPSNLALKTSLMITDDSLAASSVDLNLKLTRQRAFPSLDPNTLSATKCLLLGAGTLGCQVARMLMAWGVRKITLVDSGRVSMSNPLRQSLYTLESVKGGEYKARAAADRLKKIFGTMEADGIVMTIPMPGHPIPSNHEHEVLQNCKRLQELIDSHDAVFLLTDTRESRWLPTLLCSNANKITITAALGFDSFLVMRHGAGPLSDYRAECMSALSAEMGNASLADKRPRLGCYFCSDVVAPIDSTSNRTLDQQCTVTRPGLAPIASALAVELLLEILNHPRGIFAKAESANTMDSGSVEQPSEILPHQIRGSLSQFSQMKLVGHSSSSCTACSCTVVNEFRNRKMDFVLEAINHPTYLEDLTGLTELQRAANSFDLDWDNDTDDDNELTEI
ncbi:hypothetical protein AgCh_029474 [Apium graveolens]